MSSTLENRSGVIAGLLLLSVTVAGAGQLPAKASEAIASYRGVETRILEQADAELQPEREKLFAALQAMQEALTKAGDLDTAVAVREKLKQLKSTLVPLTMEVSDDPGNLTGLKSSPIGTVRFYRIDGRSSGGAVWGTDAYTLDSKLAVAAVHAGAVASGSSGVVKVTLVSGKTAHPGSTRNGVTTSSWGSYKMSYEIESFGN